MPQTDSTEQPTHAHSLNQPYTGLTRTPQLDTGDPVLKRREIARYFIDTFDTYTRLFDCLADDQAYYQKSIPLRHPLIFYLGHTATFFINKLVLAKTLPERIDPHMESVFSVGVDEMSWDDLNDAHYDWPDVEAVMAYRGKVRTLMLDLINTLPLKLPIDWDSPWWPVVMGIEHERIHLETSSVLIRQHDLARVRTQPGWAPNRETGEVPDNEMITVAGGNVRIGKPYDDAFYGWDNEYGEHDAQVDEFRASKFLVSNHEFLGFVEDGGYQNDDYWTEEGQGWKNFAQARHPTFWVWHNSWHLRLMTEEVEMPWDWPVEVNYHEAKAFCEWKRENSGQPIRLPTEDEWYRLCSVADIKEVGEQPANGNLHLDHGASPCPVTRFRHGEWYDVVGNVWQWTETPTYPFDHFNVHPLYDDFTTPTFDGKHNLIKGGSWISCGNEARLAARYAFRRHFFQHAGFRYIASDAEAVQPNAYYESDQRVTEYAEFHFGDTWFGVDNFPKSMATLALEAAVGKPTTRALDLGCACGRSSFELARVFDQVEGVDFSANFIRLGVELAEHGKIRYARAEEGDLVSYHTRSLEEMNLEKTAGKVTFHQGDACNLKPRFTGYDLVLAANLLDRLYRPRRFLDNIHERINEGGLLVIASPYTWLEEHTPREEWIGGYKRDGENYTTLDGLKDHLSAHFRMVGVPRKVPFVIRETQHKFQHTLSEVTVWERRPSL